MVHDSSFTELLWCKGLIEMIHCNILKKMKYIGAENKYIPHPLVEDWILISIIKLQI